MKRYAIVRVDYNCPKDVFHEYDFCLLSKGKTLADMCDHCEFLQEKRIIGDTKEQLIHKIAQVMLRKFLKGYLGTAMKPKMAEEQIGIVYKNYLEIAKEIVEVLGVE